MAQVGHIAECLLVSQFVTTGMKAFPVAIELAALRSELGPAQLVVEQRIRLLGVGTRIVVQHHVGIHLQLVVVRGLDQLQQRCLAAEPGGGIAFLVELAEIEIVVGIVAHGVPLGRLRTRRQPQRRKAIVSDSRQLAALQKDVCFLGLKSDALVPVRLYLRFQPI